MILRNFKLVSSLKVNFYKSQVKLIEISVVDINIFSKYLNCNSMYFVFKYLSISIGGNFRKMDFWRPIIHKIKAKLSMWKIKLLFMADKLWLIKSVITVLSLF